MPLQSSGKISHTDIMAEFGHAANTKWNLSADGGPYINFPSGQPKVKESDFYGKASSPQFDAVGDSFVRIGYGGNYRWLAFGSGRAKWLNHPSVYTCCLANSAGALTDTRHYLEYDPIIPQMLVKNQWAANLGDVYDRIDVGSGSKNGAPWHHMARKEINGKTYRRTIKPDGTVARQWNTSTEGLDPRRTVIKHNAYYDGTAVDGPPGNIGVVKSDINGGSDGTYKFLFSLTNLFVFAYTSTAGSYVWVSSDGVTSRVDNILSATKFAPISCGLRCETTFSNMAYFKGKYIVGCCSQNSKPWSFTDPNNPGGSVTELSNFPTGVGEPVYVYVSNDGTTLIIISEVRGSKDQYATYSTDGVNFTSLGKAGSYNSNLESVPITTFT